MFVTPVFVSRNILDPSMYASKQAGPGRREISRLSIASLASSDASFGNLQRTSSASSNTSTSTAASSTPSVTAKQQSRHRKTFSGSSFQKRFLKKGQSQESQRPVEAAVTSAPVRPVRPVRPARPVTPPPAPPAPPAPVAVAPPKPDIPWQMSDLVVRCKTDVYHVDRVIMCHHSRWFTKVCAVIIAPKASKSVIDLSADDPDAVAAMMQFCYQLDYTDQLSGSDIAVPEDITLRSHVDIYMLAERYGISGLKEIALRKFKDLAAMVLMVDGNEEQLLQAVRAMYAPERRANADDLRHVAIKLCADHVQAFIHGTGKTMAMVFESMDELPEFRTDLFEEMAMRWK